MSVEDTATLLRRVERSLEDVPRNGYEGNNRYASNVERLNDAERQLKSFSGARIDELAKRLEALRVRNEQCRPSGATATGAGPSPAAVAGAFSFDFAAEEMDGAGEAGDELADAEAALDRERKRRKEKKTAKVEKAKAEKKEMKGKKKTRDGEGEEDGAASKASPSPEKTKDGQSSSGTPTPQPTATTTEGAGAGAVALSRDAAQPSDAIPVDVEGTVGECDRVQGTALATIAFPQAVMDYDGTPCYCRVELYRCLVLALTYGTPAARATTVPPAAAGAGALEEQPQPTVPAVSSVNLWVQDNAEDIDDDGAYEEEGEAYNEEMDGLTEAQQLQQLSQELILQYETVQAEKDEEDAHLSFPKHFPVRLTTTLRQATYLPWVVLMCMGGYFAGGVFVSGRCVLHKAFQRYVVRKKQGGRQSTNAKGGGGSYGSIGSQIRAAQEVKWKIDVRDLLIHWRQHVDEAAVILYVAPGPQNRNMLTDFAVLPPPANGKRVDSPIKPQDPRFRKAPITAHRPSFEEVQRIYETVSKVNLSYLSVSEQAVD